LLFVVVVAVFVKAAKTKQKQQNHIHAKPSDAGDRDAVVSTTRIGGLRCQWEVTDDE
jgi:hypothetical protein